MTDSAQPLMEIAQGSVLLGQVAANDAADILAGQATVEELVEHYLQDAGVDARSEEEHRETLFDLWCDVAPAARRDAILAATWMGRTNPLPEVARPVVRRYAEELQRLAKEFTGGERAFLPASPGQVLKHPAAVLASSFVSDSDNEEIYKVAAYLALATAACRNC